MVLIVILAGSLVAIAMASVSLSKKPLPTDSPISESADRRWRKGVVIAAVAVAVLGNIPLAGLPGFGFLELAYPIVELLPGRWPLGGFKSGSSWPAAMLITAVWPACFLPAYRLMRLARSKGGLVATGAAGLLFAALCGVVLALAMIALHFVWG